MYLCPAFRCTLRNKTLTRHRDVQNVQCKHVLTRHVMQADNPVQRTWVNFLFSAGFFKRSSSFQFHYSSELFPFCKFSFTRLNVKWERWIGMLSIEPTSMPFKLYSYFSWEYFLCRKHRQNWFDFFWLFWERFWKCNLLHPINSYKILLVCTLGQR